MKRRKRGFWWVRARYAILSHPTNWPAWAFAATTLLGAFLLFQVQPMIAKFILPWFGGAPAVWTTCMLFFQVLLFGGYAYSHLLVIRLSLRGQAIAQAALLLAALTALPIAPADSWKPSENASPTLRILLLLTATVGLPYFMLATTSPLVQAWYARTCPGRAPYRLYALSNVGSLAALVSYPFVFEPAFDLLRQTRIWSWCFAVYGLLMALCAATVWRTTPLYLRARARVRAEESETESEPLEYHNLPSPPAPLPEGEGSKLLPSPPARLSEGEGRESPTWRRRALWLFLPAVASLVLLATTNHVCQDAAPRPFLWVLPLSLYLLSFIMCFDHPRWYVRPLWAGLAVVGIAAVLGSDTMPGGASEPYRHSGASITFAQELALQFGAMFCITMVCHGELVRLKPEPRRLTEFYLYLAAGGALGGILVGIVAPHVFSTFAEWNLGMVVSYAVAMTALFHSVPKRGRGRNPALLAAGFAAGGLLMVLLWETAGAAPDAGGPRLVDRRRNFYGVVSVWEVDRDKPQTDRLRMMHGAIVHGEQFLAPEKRRTAFNYYAPKSGIARTIAVLQKRQSSLRVGVVGLGAGTLAAFARRDDRFTFYEINPAVPELAEKYFCYLGDARRRGAEIDIEMGDARLALEQQPPQEFDLLVLDAFSGDSVPVHLLTREAMQICRRHVAAEGVIAIHVTNSYLHLFPVARALAEDSGLAWRRVYTAEDNNEFRTRSNWVIASGNRSLLAETPNVSPPPSLMDDFTAPVWTDQKNDLFRIMIGARL